MTFTLYGYKENPRSRIVRIAAAATGIPVYITTVNPRKSVYTDDYADKFPLSGGKIPAFEGPNVKLTEVIAISWYIVSVSKAPRLLGNGSPEQAAEVLSWCSWSNQELQPTLWKWLICLIPGWNNPPPYSYMAVEEGKRLSLKMLDQLEERLSLTTYLVGDDLTLADIFLHAFLTRGFEWVLDASWRDAHPNIWQYFTHKLDLGCFQSCIESFVPIERETPNVDPYL